MPLKCFLNSSGRESNRLNPPALRFTEGKDVVAVTGDTVVFVLLWVRGIPMRTPGTPYYCPSLVPNAPLHDSNVSLIWGVALELYLYYVQLFSGDINVAQLKQAPKPYNQF